jgi:tripartite-type tricarboxylate transporter receptor subunit TctC
MKRAVMLVCIGVAAPCGTGLAADPVPVYPIKPVRMIAPFPAGGGTDLIARLAADKFAESLGQPFVVDNRAGAGSTIGTAIAVKATPDGYTILLTSNGMAVSKELYPDLPYDPIKDLAPVGLVASSPNVLVVTPAIRASSVQDLVKIARYGGTPLNYASGGAGGSAHVCTEYFLKAANIKATHVAYKGTPPALTDVVAGNVQFMMAPVAPALPLMSAGRVRGLAVTSAKRTQLLPKLPTVAESGLKDFEYATWYGLFAPNGTDRRIIEKLNAAIRKALARPEVEKRMMTQGFEPTPNTVAEFTRYVRAETAKWGPIIRAARLQNEQAR